MKKIFIIPALLLSIGTLIYCNKKTAEPLDTILNGKATILVDETLMPIIEDQLQVFESDYDAKITLQPKSETEVLQSLMKDSVQIAIMTRKLTVTDSMFFVRKKLFPKQQLIN